MGTPSLRELQGAFWHAIASVPGTLRAGSALLAATEPSRTDRAQKKASEWIKIAKDKALELGKQASEAVETMREKMSTEGEAKKQ